MLALDLADYGAALSMLLPTMGIVAGYLPEPRKAVGGHALGLGIFTGFLLIAQLEGVACVTMAFANGWGSHDFGAGVFFSGAEYALSTR